MAVTSENAPSLEQLEKELKREKRKKNYGRVLRSTIFTLVVVAAAAILVVVLFLPVMQISGASMSPNLTNGDLVAAININKTKYRTGDVAAFYYNNNLMIKRVIGTPGDVVNVDGDGVVYVNGEMLREEYIIDKDPGISDIDYPYTVPDGTYFVMGDNRYMSIDSRVSSVGCIDQSLMSGKIFLRIWPLKNFGNIK